MSYIHALLYGLLQGVTEYLPISSSAHFSLASRFLFKEEPSIGFNVFLHLGTLLATLIYFWKDWLGIMASFPGFRRILTPARIGFTPEITYYPIVIGTIPALIAGGLLHRQVEHFMKIPLLMVLTLSLGGLALYLVDQYSKGDRKLSDLKDTDAMSVGMLQCLALVPGVSRSASTIIGGRLMGLSREASARFSFLLMGPVTLAAGVWEYKSFLEAREGAVIGLWIVGALSAFVAGLLAIVCLLRLIRNHGYLVFFLYRLALAVTVLFLLYE